jgi:hypothetical protein
LIKLKDEINGITEKRLEENESDVTYINNLVYAAVTITYYRKNESA